MSKNPSLKQLLDKLTFQAQDCCSDTLVVPKESIPLLLYVWLTRKREELSFSEHDSWTFAKISQIDELLKEII